MIKILDMKVVLLEITYEDLEKERNIVKNKFPGHVEKQFLGLLALELSDAGIKLNGEPINPSAKIAEKILIKLGYILVQ